MNSNINNVDNKIKIFGDGNYKSIKNVINKKELKKSLFLIDIEGGEFFFF